LTGKTTTIDTIDTIDGGVVDDGLSTTRFVGFTIADPHDWLSLMVNFLRLFNATFTPPPLTFH